MNIKTFGISLAVATVLCVGFTGCGDDEETTSSSSGTETPSSDDVYTLASTVEFENNKFSISGSGNSSTDPQDWYVFTAPERGIYTCGINTQGNGNYFLQSTHEDDVIVGGTRQYLGNDTSSLTDSNYGKVLRVAEHNNTVIVEQGDKVYLKAYDKLSYSGDITYTLDCFAPTLYTNAHQTGTITEDNTLINGVAGPYTMSLDSNNSATISGITNDTNDKTDYFRFQAQTSGDYNISIAHASNVVINASLGNGNNIGLTSISYGSSSTGNWAIKSLTVGSYYNLIVSGGSSNGSWHTNGVDANYTVTIEKQ